MLPKIPESALESGSVCAAAWTADATTKNMVAIGSRRLEKMTKDQGKV
jgi:hypothetical protein